MPSSSANSLKASLLAGGYTSTTLQTYLGTIGNRALFRELMADFGSCQALFSNSSSLDAIYGSALGWTETKNSSVALTVIAGSTFATAELCKIGANLKDVMTQPYYGYWRNSDLNYARLKAQINAAGSKYKAQAWTTPGANTWTKPATLHKCWGRAKGAGAGGGGNDNGTNQGGGGGGGGATQVKELDVSLITGNLTITIGAKSNGTAASTNPSNASNGGNTTIADGTNGTLLSAAGGTGGKGGDKVGTSPGGQATSTYIGRQFMTDWDIFSDPAQLVDAGVHGGAGGASDATGPTENGGDGLWPGGGGVGPGGGGYHGGGGASGTNTGNSNGSNGTGYGAGGGGASAGGTNNGANGTDGYARLTWIEG